MRLRPIKARWRHLVGLLPTALPKRVFAEIAKHDVLGSAAQLSFYLLLALFPLLIVITAVAGEVFAGNPGLVADILAHLRTLMPETAFRVVRDTIGEIGSGPTAGRISIGLVATLWAAASGMQALINALNRAYDVVEFRPWWKRRLVALFLTILLVSSVVLALVLLVLGGWIGSFVANALGLGVAFDRTWGLVRFLATPIFVIMTLSVIYRYAPNVSATAWKSLLPGSMIAAGIFFAATAIFRFYLDHFDSYTRTYGALGAVVVLLLWLHLTGVAIVVGGETNSEIRKVTAELESAAK